MTKAAGAGGLGGTRGPGPAADRERERDLVERHLPIVGYIVAEFRMRVPDHVPVDDLRSAAMVGLAAAARSWDPDRGVPFERFAGSRIRGAVLDELRSTDWASRSVRRRSRALRGATDALTGSLGRRPSEPEVAAHLGMTGVELQKLTVDIHRSVVLGDDALAGAEGEERHPTTDAGPETSLLARERVGYLQDAVAELPDRLRRVVVGSFYEELPMAALARELEVSESRVSQMRAEALGLMGEALRRHLDADAVPSAPAGRAERRRTAYYSAVAGRRSYRARLGHAPLVAGARAG